jgi:predicted RND superfamily exporter protein
MAQHLTRLLSSNSRSIFIVIALILIIQSIMATGIVKNTSPYFIGVEHEERQEEAEGKAIFTRSGDSVLVLLKFEGLTVFDNKVVQLAQSLSADIQQLDILEMLDHQKFSEWLLLNDQSSHIKKLVNVDQLLATKNSTIELYNHLQRSVDPVKLNDAFGEYVFPVKSVKSLINTDNIYEKDDEILVESSYYERADNKWSAQDKALILDNPLLTGGIVSKAGDSLVFHVELALREEHTQENKRLIDKIKVLVDAHLRDIKTNIKATAHYAGVPVVNGAMSDVMERDNALYFPFVVLFVLILLVISFKSVLAATYGLVISITSIIMTVGFMPILGITLNIMTTVLPIFIITIAVTDAVHVLSDVSASSRLNNAEKVHNSIQKLFRPMLITSLTTAIGFFSLAMTEITNVRSFGIMVGISVIIAFMLSVTLLPMLLIKWPIYFNKEAKKSQTFSLAVSTLLTKSNGLAWGVIVVTLVASITGINLLRVDQASIQSFDADTQLRIDNVMMNQQGVGSIPVAVWFRAKEPEGVLNSDVLNAISVADRLLNEHVDVIDSVSILGFLNQIHTVLRDDNSPMDIYNNALTRQYLFLLEGSAERDLETVVNVGPYTETRIIVSMKDDSSASIEGLMQSLADAIQPILPSNVELVFTSYGALTVTAANEVLKSQIISMVVSLILVLGIVSIVFKSFVTGVVSLIPLCMTLATMFGVMGLLGFSIDIGSSVIASIAFGIGIDYSIHFVEAVRRTYHKNNPMLGIEAALAQVFIPISVSAVVISSGFSLLLLSGFKPIANLGLLITVAMLMSALFSLVILPVILRFKSGYLYYVVAGQKRY